MTRHDDRTRLRHMLDHAGEAIAIAKRRNRVLWDTIQDDLPELAAKLKGLLED